MEDPEEQRIYEAKRKRLGEQAIMYRARRDALLEHIRQYWVSEKTKNAVRVFIQGMMVLLGGMTIFGGLSVAMQTIEYSDRMSTEVATIGIATGVLLAVVGAIVCWVAMRSQPQ